MSSFTTQVTTIRCDEDACTSYTTHDGNSTTARWEARRRGWVYRRRLSYGSDYYMADLCPTHAPPRRNTR